MIRRTQRCPIQRRGLTLLEVVLALAILTASFAALAQLVGIAVKAARKGRELTRAQLIAESLMAEISSGAVTADNLNAVPVDTDPGWLVSASLVPTIHESIMQITVVVEQDSDSLRRSQFVLTRWLRDPNLAIPEEPVQEDDQAASDASTSGSTGDSNANSGGNSNTGGNNAGGGNTGGGNAGGGNAGGGNNAGGNAGGGNVGAGNAGGGNQQGGPPR